MRKLLHCCLGNNYFDIYQFIFYEVQKIHCTLAENGLRVYIELPLLLFFAPQIL